jgi:sulfide:quinone oxidoreductase
MAQRREQSILNGMAHRIVIAGGGIAALEAAVALRTLGGTRIAPVLVSPSTEFSFRAREVGEPFGRTAPLRIPLDDLLDDLDVLHVQDSAAAVDAPARLVCTSSGRRVPYQGLLVAVGGTPFPAYAHGITFDRPHSPEDFEELLADVGAGLVADVAFLIPDAAGWTLPAYDLACMLRAWAGREGHDVRVRIVSAEAAPLEAFGSAASREVADVLRRCDIEVVCGAEPVLVSDTTMTVGGHWLTADRLVSLPRLAGPGLRGLPCDWDGFIKVAPDGAVAGCPGVFAVGDGAAHRRKQGGLAAQQADVAARALLRRAGVPAPAPPDPPRLRGVLATPEGPLYLQEQAGYGSLDAGSIASFEPLWDPPGKVATRWLGPFLDGFVLRRTGAFAA